MRRAALRAGAMPLYFTFVLALFCYSNVSAARVTLSLYALHLGAQPSAVGLLFASFFAFPLLLSWPVGMLSDRIGSRWLLLFGALCGAGGMVIPYFFRNLPALYVAGLMIGLSFAFTNVLLQNQVGLLSKPHERTRNFSNFSLIASSTSLIGPLVAGFAIDYSGHAAACLFAAAPTLVAALMLLWRDMLPVESPAASPAMGVRDTLGDPAIVRIMIVSSVVQVGHDLYQFYLPVYAYGIGLSASAIGSILATLAAASFVVRIVMPALIARLGEERLLAGSLLLAGSGFLLLPFFAGAFALALISFMFGLGMGCGQPITTMMLFGRSPAGRSGEILGMRQTANNMLRVISPPVFGLIASGFGLSPVFGLSALMMAVGGVIARPRSQRGDGASD